jgi:hypothetical protein
MKQDVSYSEDRCWPCISSFILSILAPPAVVRILWCAVVLTHHKISLNRTEQCRVSFRDTWQKTEAAISCHVNIPSASDKNLIVSKRQNHIKILCGQQCMHAETCGSCQRPKHSRALRRNRRGELESSNSWRGESCTPASTNNETTPWVTSATWESVGGRPCWEILLMSGCWRS